MEINVGGSVDDDICIFIVDGVATDDGASDGRAAEAAVEIDAGGARGGGVAEISAIAGDAVADDDVVVEVIGRQMEVGADVRVEGNAGETIVQEAGWS